MYSDTQDCEGTAPAMAASGASIVQLPTRSPLDSTVQTENANGGDWQEELYEKIKSMKEMYFSGLNDLYQKIAYRVQQDPLHQRLSNEQIEKLKIFKLALERILRFLGLNKHDLQLIHKEKLFAVEIHINFFLYPDRLRKPTSPLQEQLPQSSMQLQQPQSLDGQIDPLMQPVQGSMEAPLDSTSQKGNTNGADWHEEVYHKIKSMKEMYFLKLDDLYQKIVREVQRDPQRLSNEQIEKLNILKMMLERILRFLGLNKHDLQLTHKEKLLSVEKLILLFLYPLRKPTSSPQQEQIPQSSMLLQQPQSLDGQTNLSKQPIQRSMVAMWQNNLTNLQHNSLSGGLTISNSQQLMINTVQPGSSVDLGWGNSVNSLQQMATGSLQQNPFNNQQVYIISQRGMKPVQANLSSLLQNSNVLQQSLPELHEQQLLQNQQLRQQHPHWQMQQQLFRRQQQILQNQQLRQQYHHLQMQQQLFKRQQLRRQQQMLQIQQLRRQYHQQQMQQQLLQRQQLRRQQQLFQRQQLRRQQQMLRNQHLRQQYHLQQMQQLLFQRQLSMLLQTTLLPTHQMSQLQQSSIQLQQPQSPDGGN